MDGQLVAIFNRLDDFINVRKIKTRVYALRVHIERNSHEIAIARALAIAEEAAFDTVGPCHQAQFSRGNARATVIMRMEADNHGIAIGDIAAEIFNLVRIDIGRCGLNCCGQVEDDGLFRRRLQHVHDGCTAFQAEIQLRG